MKSTGQKILLLLGLIIFVVVGGSHASLWDSILNSDSLFPSKLPKNFQKSDVTIFNDLKIFLGVSANLQNVYKNYVTQFGKARVAPNGKNREEIFRKNLLSIAQHNLEARNQGQWSWEMGVNFFTDMFPTEMDSMYTGYKIQLAGSLQNSSIPKTHPRPTSKFVTAADSTDWRKKGMVSPIKNQGQCGSCVPFAAAATLESSHAIWHKGQILDLSEQEIVDCCHGNSGCRGGSFPPTFDYLRTHGLTTESQYPYEAADRSCRSGGKSHPARATGWWQVSPSRNEDKLKEAVSKFGPIAVAIHVNPAFQRYKSGVFDPPCSGGRNHAVVIVGYGSEGGKDFWIVKNSWGQSWGEKGFIRMRRNFRNLCDIAGDAVLINA